MVNREDKSCPDCGYLRKKADAVCQSCGYDPGTRRVGRDRTTVYKQGWRSSGYLTPDYEDEDI